MPMIMDNERFEKVRDLWVERCKKSSVMAFVPPNCLPFFEHIFLSRKVRLFSVEARSDDAFLLLTYNPPWGSIGLSDTETLEECTTRLINLCFFMWDATDVLSMKMFPDYANRNVLIIVGRAFKTEYRNNEEEISLNIDRGFRVLEITKSN